MADVVFKVVIDGKEHILKAAQDTKKLNNEIDKTAKSTRAASGAASKYKQNMGSMGVAGNARDFSKLSQTIGSGNNGLVGAYATLAANTFAVVAAFTALQNASNALKVLSGLEAQGARLGLTLSNTARNIREVTANAVSMADAMKSTAQLTAAGFDSKQIENLANVAKDASGALGRDLNDAMDRLTRGVTKLEPELLDELGLMTKLDEASQNYATELNKSAEALTAAEKRQAFMNSVVDEGTRKFGGIGDAVDEYNAYTRLAATGTDLFNDVMGTVATVMAPVAELFASNKWLMAGAIALYAASIKNDLLPALSEAAKAQAKLLSDKGEEGKLAAAKFAEQAAAVAAVDRKDPLTGKFTQNRSGNIMKELLNEMEEGPIKIERVNTALATMNEELEENITKLANATGAEKNKIEAIEATIGIQRDAIAQTRALGVNILEQKAATHSLNAINAASNVTLGTMTATYKAVTASIREQNLALKEANALRLADLEGIDRVTAGVSAGFSRRFAVMGTAVRAFGAAFLNLLPIIGQLIFAFGLLKSAWDFIADLLRTKEQEAYNKKLEEFTAIMEEATKKQEEFNRLNSLAINNASSQIDALRLTGNAVKEITTNYAELIKAREAAANSSTWDKIKGMFGADMPDESEFIKNEKRTFKGPIWTDYRQESEAYNESLDALSATYGVVDDAEKKFIKTEFEKIKAMSSAAVQTKAIEALMEDLGDRYETLAISTENLAESFKNLENSTNSFINSAAIKTPVDAMLKDLQGATSAITGMRIEMGKGSLASEDFAIALDKMGAQSSILIGDQRENFAALKKAREDLAESSKSGTMNEYTSAVQRVRNLTEEILRTSDAQVKKNQELLREKQRIYRQVEKTKEVENAIFGKIQDQLGVGAKAYLAREAHAEKMRDYEAKKLKVEMDVLNIFLQQREQELLKLKAQVKELENNSKILNMQKAITDEIVAQNRLRTEQGGGAYGLLGDFQDATVAALEKGRQKTAEFNEELELAKKGVTDTENAIMQLRDSYDALSSSITAIMAENLSKAEKTARSLNAEFQISAKFFEQMNQYADVILTTNNAIDSYNRLITRRNGEIENSYAEILAGYEKGRAALLNELTLKARQAELTAKVAQATLNNNRLLNEAGEAIKENLSNIEKEYFNDKLRIEALLDQEDVMMRLKILELTHFDTLTEGVEMQKQALSYLEKQAELIAENLKMENEMNASRRRVERIQSGLPETEQSGKNEAVRAALESFRAAKAAAQVRITAIDAEYALMHAQKIALEQELAARRHMLSLLGVSEEYLRPLDNAVAVLKSIDVSELRDLAVKGVKMSVQVEAQKVTEAVAIANQKFFFDEDSPLGKFLAYQTDNSDLSQVTAAAMRELAEPLVVQSQLAFGSVETGLEELTDKVAQEMAVLKEVKTPAVQSEEHLRAIRSVVEGKGTLTGSSLPGESLKSAVDAIAREGLRISEGPGYGGTPTSGHSRNSRHYSGNAYDINVGTGNVEANDPVMKAQMDNIAKRLVDQGFIVLWNGQRMTQAGNTALRGGQHRDHLHVEDPGNRQARSAVVSTASADEVRNNAPLQSNPQGAGLEDLRETFEKKYPSTAKALAIMSEETKPLIEQIKMLNVVTVDFAQNLDDLNSKTPMSSIKDGLVAFREGFETASMDIINLAQRMGPEGEIILAMGAGVSAITTNASEALAVFENSASTTADKVSAVGSVITGVLQTIGSISQASADARVNAIDQEIAAEQKRDGKSVASQKKIEALEKKKDQVKRKQFNMNKKLMMAESVIATATGVVKALAMGPIIGPIMAAVIGAMGAAQLAIIAGTTYQGGSSSAASTASNPSKLQVGRVGNSVNLDRVNSSAGGEVGYLRGTAGYGNSAANYRTIGSAYGGMTNRGYGPADLIVGEKGPERISTTAPMSVRPDVENKKTEVNNWNIQATDAESFEKMLEKNPAAIIKGIQRVANSSGKSFMEDVDVKSFGGRKA